MFIEVQRDNGEKILIKVEDIVRVREKLRNNAIKTVITTIDDTIYTRTTYEKVKEMINKCMQL